MPLFPKQSTTARQGAKKTSSNVINDDEFGSIKIRRVKGSKRSLRVQPNGEIVATIPSYVTIGSVRKYIDSSRTWLRKSKASAPNLRQYEHGQRVGKSHTLHIDEDAVRTGTSIKNLTIHVRLNSRVSNIERDEIIREAVKKALRIESKAYLSRRLRYLSMKHGFSYSSVRFSNAKSCWGSCSIQGTISLNIALMLLPNELIDYVILHELVHTEHMNHSSSFWSRLIELRPDAKLQKKQIANYSPFL